MDIKKVEDKEWGSDYALYLDEAKVKACIVSVEDLTSMAEVLTKSVIDTSWMSSLDTRTQRAYQRTAKETAEALAAVFQAHKDDSDIGAEFGEVMVSMASARSLELLLDHRALPIAELWKPQKKQNEGFDFHTECQDNLINFGEAKYSGSVNPHGNAIRQADGFVKDEKHLRDGVHLVNLTRDRSMSRLDDDQFGVIAAFSINSEDHEGIMDNALNSIRNSDLIITAQNVYLVGVIC